jgi:hypothetical protein
MSSSPPETRPATLADVDAVADVVHAFDIELIGRPLLWLEGVRPAAFRPEDARAFFDAMDEAFADEWGFPSMPFDEWRRVPVDESGTPSASSMPAGSGPPRSASTPRTPMGLRACTSASACTSRAWTWSTRRI